jgi:signal peptidase II
MNSVPVSRVVLFLAIAVSGCLLDLATKRWVFRRLGQPDDPQAHVAWLWPGRVGFQTSLNEGAIFGMGQGQVRIFATISLVAAVIIPLWLFCGKAAQDRTLCLALALVMAGIAGNLYDRLGLHGLRWLDPSRRGEPVYAVRDFVLVQWNDRWRWPNFNLADSMLLVGAGLLTLSALRPHCANERLPNGEPPIGTPSGSGRTATK